MPLKQISSSDNTYANSRRPSKRMAEEAKYEKKWLNDPDQFDPLLTALGRDYFGKIKSCFNVNISGKSCVDLGSGCGNLCKLLRALKAEVTAVDISTTALKTLEGYTDIKKEQQFVPYTSLPDDVFDYVIAANLIAELPESEHRLFFSELVRIAKPEGKILLSTPLDVNSEDALQKLIYLAETELELECLILSYHRMYIQGLNFLKKFHKVLGPLVRWYENRDFFLKFMEKATRFIYDSEGVSYAILIGKRKSLFESIPEIHRPVEHKGKKTIWE